METEYLQALQKQNVWWAGKIEDDPHLAEWKKHEKRWTPFELEELPLTPFSLNMVVGPRQSGKTTLIKKAVEKLVSAGGVKPKTILYARCDEITDNIQLRKVVETFFAYAGTSETYIFLDEITEVKGWEKTLKGFIDDGDFKKAVVTISGSNALQLQKGGELFPGRRGHGKDVRVLPLSFREFLLVSDPELAGKIPKIEGLEKLPVNKIKEALVFNKQLQKSLYDYFNCGGFPLAVLSYLSDGKVAESAKEAYRSWVVGDILKNEKSDVIAREIIKVVLSKAPTPVSWEGVSQETSIKSPPTVASYIDLLDRLFVVLPMYAVNPSKATKEFAKNKKLHLQDPFLWNLMEEWCLQPIAHKTEVIAEATLAEHVARFLLKKYGGRRLNDYVSYWRNGYEIDVIAHTREGGLRGFEMKLTDRRQSFAQKVGPIKNLVYVSKTFFNEKNPTAIPLAVLLAML
ncbi:ATP-binding protein [Candidatus Micrarchaeota archaeon]|nr:ATP-binding protein [Candidatus Micrarchaeota archaeon]